MTRFDTFSLMRDLLKPCYLSSHITVVQLTALNKTCLFCHLINKSNKNSICPPTYTMGYQAIMGNPHKHPTPTCRAPEVTGVMISIAQATTRHTVVTSAGREMPLTDTSCSKLQSLIPPRGNKNCPTNYCEGIGLLW